MAGTDFADSKLRSISAKGQNRHLLWQCQVSLSLKTRPQALGFLFPGDTSFCPPAYDCRPLSPSGPPLTAGLVLELLVIESLPAKGISAFSGSSDLNSLHLFKMSFSFCGKPLVVLGPARLNRTRWHARYLSQHQAHGLRFHRPWAASAVILSPSTWGLAMLGAPQRKQQHSETRGHSWSLAYLSS